MQAVRRMQPLVSENGGQLSERQVQQIIDALQGTMPLRHGLRHWPRLNMQGYLTLQPIGAAMRGSPRKVGIYDISRTGIAIYDQQAASPGERFVLQIARKLRRPLELLCTVRNCRAENTGYVIGAEYGASSLDAMNAMIMPPMPALKLALDIPGQNPALPGEPTASTPVLPAEWGKPPAAHTVRSDPLPRYG